LQHLATVSKSRTILTLSVIFLLLLNLYICYLQPLVVTSLQFPWKFVSTSFFNRSCWNGFCLDIWNRFFLWLFYQIFSTVSNFVFFIIYSFFLEFSFCTVNVSLQYSMTIFCLDLYTGITFIGCRGLKNILRMHVKKVNCTEWEQIPVPKR